MVDDVPAQHRLEVDLRRLGRAGDRAGRDEVREQGRVSERRRQVDEEDLARELAGQRGRRIDGERRGAGPALGGEERDDRSRQAGGALCLARGRRRQFLLPQLVQDHGDLLDVRSESFQEAVPIEGQQDCPGEPIDAGGVAASRAGRGEDDEVAGSRSPGQQNLARSVSHRLLHLARREKHHDVSTLAAEPESVPCRQANHPHPAGDGSQNAVV